MQDADWRALRRHVGERRTDLVPCGRFEVPKRPDVLSAALVSVTNCANGLRNYATVTPPRRDAIANCCAPKLARYHVLAFIE